MAVRSGIEDMRYCLLTVIGFFEGSSVGFADGELYEKKVKVKVRWLSIIVYIH